MPDDLRRPPPGRGLELLRRPRSRACRPSSSRDAVQRLHRRMREVGKLELGLEHLGGARERARRHRRPCARDRAGLLGELAVLGHRARRCRASRPAHSSQSTSARRGPSSPPRCPSATTATPRGVCDDVDHALALPSPRRRRTTSTLPPNAAGGRPPRSACPAAGRRSVNCCRPVDLARHVEPRAACRCRCRQVLRVLELDLARHGELRPPCRRARRRSPSCREACAQHALVDRDLAGGHVPGLAPRRRPASRARWRRPCGSCSHELAIAVEPPVPCICRPRRDCRRASALPAAPSTRICDQSASSSSATSVGEAGIAPWPISMCADEHGHGVVGRDPHEGIRVVASAPAGRRGAAAARAATCEADREPGAGGGRRRSGTRRLAPERPTLQSIDAASHGQASSSRAASWMAARMR